MTRLTREERETVVHWSEAGCSVSTHDERQAHRLIRAGAKVRREGERGGVAYWVLDCPHEWARFPKPPTKRNMTDEQRAAAGARLKARRIES